MSVERSWEAQAMSQTSLVLLGLPQVYYAGQNIKFRTRKALALLVYLVVEGGLHSREKLATLFWPDSEPDHSRMMLRTTLNYLRQAFFEASATADNVPLVVERQALGFDFDSKF